MPAAAVKKVRNIPPGNGGRGKTSPWPSPKFSLALGLWPFLVRTRARSRYLFSPKSSWPSRNAQPTKQRRKSQAKFSASLFNTTLRSRSQGLRVWWRVRVTAVIAFQMCAAKAIFRQKADLSATPNHNLRKSQQLTCSFDAFRLLHTTR